MRAARYPVVGWTLGRISSERVATVSGLLTLGSSIRPEGPSLFTVPSGIRRWEKPTVRKALTVATSCLPNNLRWHP